MFSSLRFQTTVENIFSFESCCQLLGECLNYILEPNIFDECYYVERYIFVCLYNLAEGFKLNFVAYA